MDFLRTPGAALEGAEKKKFGTFFYNFVLLHCCNLIYLYGTILAEETKALVDAATNDFLVRADWNANMSCVDKINSIHNAAL